MDVPTTTEETQISELIPVASESRFPIAVLNEDGKFAGIISKAAILTSLR